MSKLPGIRPIGTATLLAGLAVACAEAPPPFAIDQARIVYTSREGGKPHLQILDRATGISSALLPDSASTWDARISRDGRQIAYLSRRDGNYEIYVRAVADTGIGRNLTRDPDYDVLPAWSPDGRRLAFMSTRGFALGSIGPFPGHIYVATLAGDTVEQVTREPLTSSLGPGSWSPDGRYLTLSREVDGQLDLFLLDLGDGTERRITDDPDAEYSADISHDGHRVAFHAESDTASHIVVMDLDGSNRRTLTSGPGFRYTPRWSPDDQWLMYTATGATEGDFDIRAVRVSDGADIPILATETDAREGVWLP